MDKEITQQVLYILEQNGWQVYRGGNRLECSGILTIKVPSDAGDDFIGIKYRGHLMIKLSPEIVLRVRKIYFLPNGKVRLFCKHAQAETTCEVLIKALKRFSLEPPFC
ncbi:MAG: hypothetical protein Q7K28_00740 [Candidatus Wildermuthbacteria bacterium]|nr:hypothetical protein [Candidatus Wildermuthbacteria bacterium]